MSDTENVPDTGKYQDEISYVAIIANSSSQVGIVTFIAAENKFILTTIYDSRMYHDTVNYLKHRDAFTFIIPSSHYDRHPLFNALEREIVNFSKILLPRGKFNEDNGLARATELIADNPSTCLTRKDISGLYLCCAALAALFFQLEVVDGIVFSNMNFFLVVKQPDSELSIDISTLRELELMKNKVDNRKLNSVFDLLDHTVTKQGKRRLKKELLSPPANIQETMKRLGAVSELRSDIFDIKSILVENLRELHDIDVLINFYSRIPKNFSNAQLHREVNNALRLREIISGIMSIGCRIKPLQSQLMISISETIIKYTATFTDIVSAINSRLEPNISYECSAEERHSQSIFAVKKGVDGLLDVARCTYLHTFQEIEELVDEYQEKMPTLNITLFWTLSRGYHLRYRKRGSASAKRRALQSVDNLHNEKNVSEAGITFIRKQELSSTVKCTTEDLFNLTERLKVTEVEILERTVEQLSMIREKIKDSGILLALVEVADNIGMIDLLYCIADVNEAFPEWSTVQFDEDILDIQDFYHPLAFRLQDCESDGFFVKNTINLQLSAQKIALIVGPNCAGKSTVLKSVALIFILGQIGFNVPAQKAVLPLIGAIFSRLGTEDDIEGNASTFKVEMSESARILESLNRRKKPVLTIIDELGRGTAPIDGVSIAWACLEKICTYNSFVLFVTHYTEFLSIPKQVPNLVCLYKFGATSPKPKGLDISHQMQLVTWEDKQCFHDCYGVNIARVCGLPRDVTDCAMKYRDVLLQKESRNSIKLEDEASRLPKSELTAFKNSLRFQYHHGEISKKLLDETLMMVQKQENLMKAKETNLSTSA